LAARAPGRRAMGRAWARAARIPAPPRTRTEGCRRGEVAVGRARLRRDAPARARLALPVEIRERGERAPGRAARARRPRRDRCRWRARGGAGPRLLPVVRGHLGRRPLRSTTSVLLRERRARA